MSYTDIFNNSPDGLSMGMPTIDTGAAVANLGQTPNTGLTTPSVTSPVMNAPTVPGTTGGAAPQKPGFFSPYGPAQFALGAIQTLGSLFNSYQQNKLAKEAMKFQKEAFATNLENQEQSYNTALEDRIHARYVTEGKSQAEADSYIERNRL